MTTNKPGSVNQQPLYGCTSCYEEVTYPAGDLGVYGGECWCEYCWDNRSADFTDQPEWNDLEPFTPALQAECEKLRKDAQEHKDRYFREVYGLNNEGDPIGGDPADGLVHQVARLLEERNGLRDECEKLRKDAERYDLLASMIVAESTGAVMTPQQEALFVALNTITHLRTADEVHAMFDDAMQEGKP